MKADPRLAEIVIKELGLETAKASKFPGVKIGSAKLGAKARDE